MERETYQGKRYYVASVGTWSYVFKSYWMRDTAGNGADALAAGRKAGIEATFADWDELLIDGPYLFQWQAKNAMKKLSALDREMEQPAPLEELPEEAFVEVNPEEREPVDSEQFPDEEPFQLRWLETDVFEGPEEEGVVDAHGASTMLEECEGEEARVQTVGESPEDVQDDLESYLEDSGGDTWRYQGDAWGYFETDGEASFDAVPEKLVHASEGDVGSASSEEAPEPTDDSHGAREDPVSDCDDAAADDKLNDEAIWDDEGDGAAWDDEIGEAMSDDEAVSSNEGGEHDEEDGSDQQNVSDPTFQAHSGNDADLEEQATFEAAAGATIPMRPLRDASKCVEAGLTVPLPLLGETADSAAEAKPAAHVEPLDEHVASAVIASLTVPLPPLADESSTLDAAIPQLQVAGVNVPFEEQGGFDVIAAVDAAQLVKGNGFVAEPEQVSVSDAAQSTEALRVNVYGEEEHCNAVFDEGAALEDEFAAPDADDDTENASDMTTAVGTEEENGVEDVAGLEDAYGTEDKEGDSPDDEGELEPIGRHGVVRKGYNEHAKHRKS